MPKIHGYTGAGVNVRLHDMRSTPDVFWSRRGNSYVLTRYVGPPGEATFFLPADPTGFVFPVSLLSVNGVGEIRWEVRRWNVDYALRAEGLGTLGTDRNSDPVEQLEACRHFGLHLFEHGKI